MSIDPARLARIRARVLVAATLAVPACGGVPPHVNERAHEPPSHVNEPAPDDKPKPVDGPINEHVTDQPTNTPVPRHINTPAPQSAVDPVAPPAEANRPTADAQAKKAPTPADIPPPGQTINVAAQDPRPQHINVRTKEPPPAPKKTNGS